MMKQEKFRKDFEKTTFQFECHSLVMPKGAASNEDFLEVEDQMMSKHFLTLGTDMQDINDIIINKLKSMFIGDALVAQHSWVSSGS